ncbi:MAG: DMT family transporter [Gaiellaceae bacterium]
MDGWSGCYRPRCGHRRLGAGRRHGAVRRARRNARSARVHDRPRRPDRERRPPRRATLVRRLRGRLRCPKWLWLGAAIGVIVVGAITVSAPRIGTTATVALLIAGQLGAALAIDRFGWFGIDRVTITWFRVLGVVLLVAGAALTLRR